MTRSAPSVSVSCPSSTRSNELGMHAMHERAYEKQGEQYLLTKLPHGSRKSRALMFTALDKLYNQDLKEATIATHCDPGKMLAKFRDSRHREDAPWEHAYISRRFKDDTENLEKLFIIDTKVAVG